MDQPQTNEDYAKLAFSLVQRDFPDCKLLNLYFWGSRWAETHNQESDWDFLAILDSNYQQPDINNIIQDTNIDILLYEVSKFQALVDFHVPWAMAVIYGDSLTLQATHIFEHQLTIPMLRKALFVNTNVNMRQAKALFRDGDYIRGRKRLAAVLRMTDNAIQITEHGRIINKLSAQRGILSILDSGLEQWDPMNQLFLSFQTPLETQFNEVSYCESKDLPSSCTSPTRAFIIQNGLQKAVSMFALDAIKHKQHQNLILLTRKPFMSPDYEIPNECHIVIFDLNSFSPTQESKNSNETQDSENDFKIIAKSFPFFCGLKGVKSKFVFDKSKIRVYDQPDGLLAVLYFYQGTWHVSSLKSPDGTDLLNDGKTFAELFWSLWKENGFQMPKDPTPNADNYCFYFEMVSANDRRRIKYDKNDLFCIGGYDLTLNKEIHLFSICEFYPTWKKVKQMDFESIEEIDRSCLDNVCSYVAVTENFERTSFRGQVYHVLLKLQFQPNEYAQELLVLDLMPLYSDHVFFKDVPSYRTPKEVVEKVVKRWNAFIVDLDVKYKHIEEMNWKDTDTWVAQYGGIKHFLLWMKKANINSAQKYFAENAHVPRMQRSLVHWYKAENGPPQQAPSLQFCFK